MIQEKDFLYRVPVKTAPITTPGGQIRNPEILVDVEGGEFMHGNILDANSTNKLINQSVKDAVDNKLVEGGYVTKDLLEAETTRATEQENSLKTLIDAETSARTKGDEDLSSKIKAEQTRAEGKEKEISDKLAIVNGDSNTEGSFRKAIADVVAAAPEDLDTLKEIADNQNSSLVMDAIRGNANAITQLASSLNCDFNALNNAICCVRSGIQEVAGNVNFSAERVINAINLGDANLTSALQNCCCQTQQNIIKMGYENQLGQKDIVNQMQTGFSYTNTGLERATSNLGFQMSQMACDLKTNANANTQRIVDVLNNHWQSDLQQRYNDARLELSQQKQNATLIAALKTTAAA